MRRLSKYVLPPPPLRGVVVGVVDVVGVVLQRAHAQLSKIVSDERVSLLVLFGPECDASDYADVEKLKAFNYTKEEANERDAKGNVPLYYAIKNRSVGAPIIQVRRTPLFLTL